MSMSYCISQWLNMRLPPVDDGTRVLECHETLNKVIPTQASRPPVLPSSEPITPPRRFDVGAVVRVIGTVQSKKGSKEPGYNRQMSLQSIEELLDLREECLHWQQVLDLHESQYSKPFSVPPPPPNPIHPSLSTPERKRNTSAQDVSPTFSRSSVVSCSSPIQSSEDVRTPLPRVFSYFQLTLYCDSNPVAIFFIHRSYGHEISLARPLGITLNTI